MMLVKYSALALGVNAMSAERSQKIEDLIHNHGQNQLKAQLEHEEDLSLEEAQAGLTLPEEVTGLVQTKEGAALTDAAIGKAIGILNEMIENAQEEIDAKMISCKQFYNRIHQNLAQIRTDLARFGANIARSEKVKADSANCIEKSDSDITAVQQAIDKEVRDYTSLKEADDLDMTGRVNDLAVAEFIMEITKCKKKAMLLQNHHQVMACSSSEGSELLAFADPEVQVKLEQLLRGHSRNLMQNALQASVDGEQSQGSVLLQLSAHQVPKKQKKTSDATGPKQGRKCSLAKPNCGLLHDNMSLMWGEMKDAVDELQAKMDADAKHHKDEITALNMQLSVLFDAKTTCQTNLADATSTINANNEEQAKKQEEEIAFKKEFSKVWAECQATLEELIFTRSCGTRKVRSEVAKKGKKIKPDSIVDCEVTEFIPGPCTSPCDRDMKGGTQKMMRSITQMNNKFGQKCPTLNYVMKCNQIRCPVDCKMSKFSRYSDCSKECGGGVQTRTRYVVRGPKNGGESCDVTSEARACNTGSCTRRCLLHRWTKWTPCTKACNRGRTQRFRHVRRKARGRGRCPKKWSHKRRQAKWCNRLRCYGDEECVAHQDLIIAIDGSGSVKEHGFFILKNFTSNLVARYRGKAMHQAKMRVGIIQFGNGEIVNKTITPAKVISPLTDDIKPLAKKVLEMKWAKGFTNMAQAFTTAKPMFLNGGRKSAQSSLTVITDGLPSFKFQTQEAVMELRDMGVHVNIICVRADKGEETKLMKSWVSYPKRTHFMHVKGGLLGLSQQWKKYVTKTIVATCPRASSPKRRALLTKHRGWKMVRENFDCPNWWVRLNKGRRRMSRNACAAQATAKGFDYFVYGKSKWYGGICFSHKEGGKNGSCSWKRWNGKKGFTRSRFDVYQRMPATVGLVQTDAEDSEDAPEESAFVAADERSQGDAPTGNEWEKEDVNAAQLIEDPEDPALYDAEEAEQEKDVSGPVDMTPNEYDDEDENENLEE